MNRAYHYFGIYQKGVPVTQKINYGISFTKVKKVTIEDVDTDIDGAIDQFFEFLTECGGFVDAENDIVIMEARLMGGENFCKKKNKYSVSRMLNPGRAFYDGCAMKRPNTTYEIKPNILSFVDITTERPPLKPKVCTDCFGTLKRDEIKRCTQSECGFNILCRNCGINHYEKHDQHFSRVLKLTLEEIESDKDEAYVSTEDAMPYCTTVPNNAVALVRTTRSDKQEDDTDIETELTFNELFKIGRQKYGGDVLKVMNCMTQTIMSKSSTNNCYLVHNLCEKLVI